MERIDGGFDIGFLRGALSVASKQHDGSKQQRARDQCD